MGTGAQMNVGGESVKNADSWANLTQFQSTFLFLYPILMHLQQIVNVNDNSHYESL